MRRSVRIKNFISKLVIIIGIVLFMAAAGSIDSEVYSNDVYTLGTVGVAVMYLGYKALNY